MKKIFLWIRKILAKSKQFSKTIIEPSISVVELLKAAIDSPAAPILAALTPTGIDDMLVIKLRQVLPEVLKVLGYAEDCMKAPSNEALITCVVAKIRLFTDERKDAAYLNIATLLASYLTDGKLSWSEAIVLCQTAYDDIKGK